MNTSTFERSSLALMSLECGCEKKMPGPFCRNNRTHCIRSGIWHPLTNLDALRSYSSQVVALVITYKESGDLWFKVMCSE